MNAMNAGSRLQSRSRLAFATLLAVGAGAALLVTSANATPTEVGAKISIFGGTTQTFPAGQPFHFTHRWTAKPNKDGSIGLWRFALTLDGVNLNPSFIDIEQIDDPVFGHVLGRRYVFNFPNGLTGTHVFAGTFTGPCNEMVAQGFATGPCPTPNAVVDAPAFSAGTTVTFVP